MATTGSSQWPPCRVAVMLGGVAGWMSWPDDQIYRPAVGLFMDGVLRAAVPTFRSRQVISGGLTLQREDLRKSSAPSGSRPGWVCAFDIAGDLIGSEVRQRDIRDISVVCLETGQVLYPALSPLDLDDSSGVLAIDDLITRTLYFQEPPDVSGFSNFLSLSTRDQLAVLYLTVLGREVDREALETFDAQLIDGATTILDIRDQMLTSSEFANRKISIYERIGLWTVWGGLCEVVPSVLPMPASLTSDPRDTATAERREGVSEWDVGFLAALALGPGSRQPSVRDLWVFDHTPVGASLQRPQSKVARAPVVSRVGIRFPDLLSSMEIGPAGARGANGVHAVRGREGVVVYGAYLTLPAGQYSLTVFIEDETPAEDITENSNCVRIEAVYAQIIMGYVLMSSRDLRRGSHVVSFIVPQCSMKCLDEALFEFRVWSQGLNGYCIRSLSLEVDPPSKDRIQFDWLPLMRVGGAGRRVSNDSAQVGATLTSRGHVVFGPYIRLVPGRYRLIVECTILECAEPKANIDVEVATASDENLAARTYELALGANVLELEFMINRQIFSMKEGGDIEFRVHKMAGSELIITGIKTIYKGMLTDYPDVPNISSDFDGGGQFTQRVQQPPAIQPGTGTGSPRSGNHWLLSRFLRRRGANHPQSQ
jgi:hypothetical protein